MRHGVLVSTIEGNKISAVRSYLYSVNCHHHAKLIFHFGTLTVSLSHKTMCCGDSHESARKIQRIRHVDRP